MKAIEKIKLSSERVKLVNQLKAKELKGIDKILASKRVQEIVTLLKGGSSNATADAAPPVDALPDPTAEIVLDPGIDLSPFERIVQNNEITIETLQGAVDSTRLLLNSLSTPKIFIDAVNVVSEQVSSGALLDSLGAAGQDLVFTLDCLISNSAKTIQLVDAQAQTAATSIVNEGENPTQEQLVANDYKTAKVSIAGMPISIENPIGSVRRGVDENGTAWETTMTAHYGYFDDTMGADGDELDVFIAEDVPHDYDGRVFVVNQIDRHGNFDEHKVILGVRSKAMALALYQAHYDENFNGVGSLVEMSLEDLKARIYGGQTALFDSMRGMMLDAWSKDGHYDLLPVTKLDLGRLDDGHKEAKATVKEPIVVYVQGSKNYVIHGRKRLAIAASNAEKFIPAIVVEANEGYTLDDIKTATKKCGSVVHAEALGAMIEICAESRLAAAV